MHPKHIVFVSYSSSENFKVSLIDLLPPTELISLNMTLNECLITPQNKTMHIYSRKKLLENDYILANMNN